MAGLRWFALRKAIAAFLTIVAIVCANFVIFRIAPGDPYLRPQHSLHDRNHRSPVPLLHLRGIPDHRSNEAPPYSAVALGTSSSKTSA